MNEAIVARFESYHRLLIECPAVFRCSVIKRRIGLNDGHIRVQVELTGNGLLEFSEYVAMDAESLIDRAYSFHWQDAQQRLIRRWDNAKHFPQLPHAPHHIHQANGTVEGNPEEPTLAAVLCAIEENGT